MTIEQFQAAVAAATTGEQLDVLESQMIAIGHAHDAPLRVSVEERRAAIGATPGPALLDLHRQFLAARLAMAEKVAADPESVLAVQAEHVRGLKARGASGAAEHEKAARRHANAVARTTELYTARAKELKAALTAFDKAADPAAHHRATAAKAAEAIAARADTAELD